MAIVWRRRVIFTRSSWRACAAAGAGAANAATSVDGVGAPLAAATTSSLVRRPSLPVPLILLGSMPSSRTRRRTEGESGRSLFSTCATDIGAAVVVIAGAIAAATGAGADAGALFPASMDPITAPTLTVAPSSTAYVPMMPATGEGTSIATLSVSRLAIGSSMATASPGFFNHWPRVASVIDSPNTGTLTSVLIILSSLGWRGS